MDIMTLRMPAACFCIVLFILVSYKRRKELSSYVTNIFTLLVGCCVLHLAMEIVTEYTVNHRSAVPPLLNDAFHILFELTVLWYALLLNIYFVSAIELRKNVRSKAVKMFITVACIVISIGIIVAPHEYIDTQYGSYSRGVKAYLLYVGVILAIINTVQFVVRNRRYVRSAEHKGLIMSGVIAVALACIQMIFPFMLMTGFIMTLVTLNLYLSLENPDAYYNSEKNMFNGEALKRVLKEKCLLGYSHEILAVALKPVSGNVNDYVDKQMVLYKKVFAKKYNMDAYCLTDRLYLFVTASVFRKPPSISGMDAGRFNKYKEHLDTETTVIECAGGADAYNRIFDRIEELKMNFINDEIHIDAMTGVYNRNRYESDIASIREKEIACYVAIADINGLKYVNDHYGHNVGDVFIKETAKVLLRVFSGLGKVYRTGGDEFTMIYFGELPIDEVSQQLKAAIEDRRNALGFPFSFAVGYAYSENGDSIDSALNNADKNMYAEKMKSEYHR